MGSIANSQLPFSDNATNGNVVDQTAWNQMVSVFQTAINDNFYRRLAEVTVLNSDGTVNTQATLQNASTITNNLQVQMGNGIQITPTVSNGNITLQFSVPANSVTSTQIASGAVGTTQIANNAVTSAQIASGAVGTTQIASNAVTLPKLDPSLVPNTIMPYLPTAPTTGTWSAGQYVWNNNPQPGGNVGWICTASGTPGTWYAFGLISLT